MAASKMQLWPSGHPSTRRSRPTHSREPPKHAGWPRRAQRAVRCARSAGCHPPWRPQRYERHVHGHHARAERVGRDWVGLSSTWSTSKRRGAHIGSMAKYVRWTTPPWAPTATTGGTSTVTTRTPSVSGVIGWVSAARRAPPRVRARMGSICVGVALRRVVPCAAPEPPWRPLEPRHVPGVHAERGREEHGTHGYRPRARGSRAAHGTHMRGPHCTPCALLAVRHGGRAKPTNPKARTA